MLPILGSTDKGGGPVTFTLVQHPTNFTCTTAACSVTTSPTTAGNLLVLWSAALYSVPGVSVANVMALTSVTDNGTAETWTHCPSSVINDAGNSNGALHALDCYYILNAAGGATSVTATWTLIGLTSPTIKVDVEVLEYHPSATPIFYDTANAFLQSGTCSACPGPAGLLSGNSDVVTQAMYDNNSQSISSISAPYSNPFDTDAAGNALFAGFAGAINSASYSQPTWTLSALDGNPTFYSSLAFSGNSTPAPTAQLLSDFSACTNGLQPTTNCVGNSTFSGWGVIQTGLSAANPGMTVCTSVMNTNLPGTTTINGVAKSGGSTLDLCGVTSTTGTNIGYYEFDLGLPNLNSLYNPLTVGFSFRTDCTSGTLDCGAVGGRLTNNNSTYLTAHCSNNANGHWWMENNQTPISGLGDTGAACSPNTNYRINLQFSGLSGVNDRIKVCADGPGGAVLGTANAANSGSNFGASAVQIGVVGEEPTTSGFHYYFRNIVVGGIYADTGPCF